MELVNVADRSEWNAAILSATADFEDNYYTFRIEVVCYGRDLDLDVNLEVFGVNAASSDDTTAGNLSLEESVPCASDQVYTLIFKYFPDENHTDAVEAYEKTLPEMRCSICSAPERDHLLPVRAYQSFGERGRRGGLRFFGQQLRYL
ncbi:MAG: hypothetical protein L6V84_00170 [Oscillospiraceae bacterium]|nr:MAG: hypothetical protein L6V84_00170 [Oscillospiraceae bacterium]